MSASAATLLSQTQDAISGLLQALANVNVQEYWMSDGRRIVRADFPKTLEQLRQLEIHYINRAAVESGQSKRFSLARFGRRI
jgi:hypothetical protein